MRAELLPGLTGLVQASLGGGSWLCALAAERLAERRGERRALGQEPRSQEAKQAAGHESQPRRALQILLIYPQPSLATPVPTPL